MAFRVAIGREAGLHSAPWLSRPTAVSTHPNPIPICRPACSICGLDGSIVPSRLFRPALGRHGERPDILHFLAVCLSQRGALGDAEAMWRKALAKDPNEPMLSYNLGLVARRQAASTRRRGAFATRFAARRLMSKRAWRWRRFIWTSNGSPPPSAKLIEFVTNVDQGIQQGGEGLKPAAGPRPQHAGYALYVSVTIPRRSRSSTWP